MKPLRRSLAFWSGVILLLFLLWIWAHSYGMKSGIVTHLKQGSPHLAMLERGDLEFRIPDSGAADLPPGTRSLGFVQDVSPPPDIIWPKDYRWRRMEENPYSISRPRVFVTWESVTVLPYAIVPAGFCVLWLALLAWHRRRQRKLAARMAAMESAAG